MQAASQQCVRALMQDMSLTTQAGKRPRPPTRTLVAHFSGLYEALRHTRSPNALAATPRRRLSLRSNRFRLSGCVCLVGPPKLSPFFGSLRDVRPTKGRRLHLPLVLHTVQL